MTDNPEWKQLLTRYGRDALWLDSAVTEYCGKVRSAPVTAPRVACVSLYPTQNLDFGLHYGLGSGHTLHFLLESEPLPPPAVTQPQAVAQTDTTLWDSLITGLDDLFCIPVKTGRAALGWQLRLALTAIRPLALLRPYYLFCSAPHLPDAPPSASRRVDLADTHRLGKLLDSGYVGVELLSKQTVVCRPSR